jgi:hypothetical protein
MISLLLDFPPVSYRHSSSTPIRATCPAWWRVRVISSLCRFPQPPVISSRVGPDILLNTLFSNTLSVCSSRHKLYCFLSQCNLFFLFSFPLSQHVSAACGIHQVFAKIVFIVWCIPLLSHMNAIYPNLKLCRRPSFTPIQNHRQNYSFFIIY